MKKQKFRGMYTIVTLSFVLGLTACQATPEEDVIVQKAELAEKLMELTSSLTMENPEARLVLITNNLDTRFEVYGVMRPIELAH